METYCRRWSSDTDQCGAPRLRAIHLQCNQRTRLQWSLHTDGGGQWVEEPEIHRSIHITFCFSIANGDWFADSLLCAAPPYATCLPDQVRLQPGDALFVQCLAHGSHPITFSWSRVGRGALPPGTVTTKDGKLQIARVKLGDSGSYKCVATNHIGTSEAVVQVTVKGVKMFGSSRNWI